MSKTTKTLLVLLIALFIIDLFNVDDTDRSRFVKSGMTLRTDYGTGCQYLGGAGIFGKEVLTPRLDKDGKQICNKKE